MTPEQAWSAGFYSGLELDTNSPFKARTAEENNWRQGWIQGALKRFGFPYYGSQEDQELNQNRPLSPESELWAKKLEDQYFSP